MKNKDLLYISLIGLLLVTIIILFVSFTNKIDKINDLTGIIDLTEREVEVYKDKENKLNARVETLELNNISLLGDIKTKDSTVLRLRDEYNRLNNRNRQLNSLLAINNSTIIKYQDSIRNLISAFDTIINGDSITVYPVYTRDVTMFDDWITGNISLGYRTTIINLVIKSKQDITLYRERPNIFSKYKTYANVRNLNPYDVTEDFVVVMEKDKTNRFNVSVGVGVDVFSRLPTIGIYAGYTIIRF